MYPLYIPNHLTSNKICLNCGKTLKDIEIRRNGTCVYCNGRVKSIHFSGCSFASNGNEKVLKLREVYTYLYKNGLCYFDHSSRGEFGFTEDIIFPHNGALHYNSTYTTGFYDSVSVTHRYTIKDIGTDGILTLSEALFSPKIVKTHEEWELNEKPSKFKPTEVRLAIYSINEEYGVLRSVVEKEDSITYTARGLHVQPYRG